MVVQQVVAGMQVLLAVQGDWPAGHMHWLPGAAQVSPRMVQSAPVQQLPRVMHWLFAAQSLSGQQSLVGTQALVRAQTLCPVGHVHVPPGMGHTSPVFVQSPLWQHVFSGMQLLLVRQGVLPVGQVMTHWPWSQTAFASHRLPQRPQLSGSLPRSTHWVPHRDSSGPHAEASPSEASPASLPPSVPELLPLPDPELLPELLAEPLPLPDPPLEDENVASLPPASLLSLLLTTPPEQLARPVATASAASPRTLRFMARSPIRQMRPAGQARRNDRRQPFSNMVIVPDVLVTPTWLHTSMLIEPPAKLAPHCAGVRGTRSTTRCFEGHRLDLTSVKRPFGEPAAPRGYVPRSYGHQCMKVEHPRAAHSAAFDTSIVSTVPARSIGTVPFCPDDQHVTLPSGMSAHSLFKATAP